MNRKRLVCLGSFALVGAAACLPARDKPKVVRMPVPSEIFDKDAHPKPEDLAKFTKSLRDESGIFDVRTSTSGPVEEPALQGPENPDLERLGHGSSQFLVDSRWSTIRFLGDAPAGAGLAGEEQDKAQIAALGKTNDTIPVVTAAWTIHHVMEEFFAPLLRRLPDGEALLKRFKVQGAYFSPTYVPAEGGVIRDNAFLVGLQSLELWPSSCFETESDLCVEPFMSAGHDPTIVAHEIGHAVFNHLRNGRSLEGFQWVAANEGYADFFSAVYFSEPRLGRIWKITDKPRGFELRRLGGDVSSEDEKAAAEAHSYGQVWSSILWNIRKRLIEELAAKPADLDLVFLYSIRFLGETEILRLGDAGIALIKANTTLGKPEWKAIMVEEFEKTDLRLEEENIRAQQSAVSGGGSEGKPSGGSSCGVVAHAGVGRWWALLPGFAPLLWGLARRWRRWLALALCAGCVREKATPPGESLGYDCDANAMAEATGLEPAEVKVHLTWLGGEGAAATFLVSDDRFLKSPSAVQLIVDRERRKIDQVRDKDGKPLSFDLSKPFLGVNDINQQANVLLGTVLVEAAPQNLVSPSADSPFGIGYSGVAFRIPDPKAVVTLKEYGPLPTRVVRTDGDRVVCAFSGRSAK